MLTDVDDPTPLMKRTANLVPSYVIHNQNKSKYALYGWIKGKRKIKQKRMPSLRYLILFIPKSKVKIFKKIQWIWIFKSD